MRSWFLITVFLVLSAGCGQRRTDRSGDPWGRPMPSSGRRSADMMNLSIKDVPVKENIVRKPACLMRLKVFEVIGSRGLVKGENEVKQGTYPFMALVYYSDNTKLEDGKRFTRNAVLIKPQWLVSSHINVNDSSTFPQKTLLARAGATTIDPNLTLNEEENEQEREIIQIVYPSDMSETQWWHYDISLLKTLEPFTITSAVTPTTLELEPHDYVDKTCYVVMYGNKNPNSSDVRILMESSVQILPPENCGSYFRKNMMICSTEGPNKFSFDSSLCKTNRGGPLVYGNKVIGLQTYINDCQEPHLYQLLQAWTNFISCGESEECQTKQCKGICTALDKDPVTTATKSSTEETSMLSAKPNRRNLMPDNVTTSIVLNEVREVSTSTTAEGTRESITTDETTHESITTNETTREPTTTNDTDVTTKYTETYTIVTTTTTTSTIPPTLTPHVDVQPSTDKIERKVEIEAKKLVNVPAKKNIASLTTTEVFKILIASIFAFFV